METHQGAHRNLPERSRFLSLWWASFPPVAIEPKAAGRAADRCTRIQEQWLTGQTAAGAAGGVPPIGEGGETAGALSTLLVISENMVKAGASQSPAKSEKKSGFSKWSEPTQQMVLLASECLREDAEDAEGNPCGGAVQREPLPVLASILDTEKLASAKQYMEMTLKHKLQCNICLPDAAVLAIREGSFLRQRPDLPTAFSLLAFGPVDYMVLAASLDPNDSALLNLASQEGKGLSDAEVKQMAKITLQYPIDLDELADHLRNIICVLYLLQ